MWWGLDPTNINFDLSSLGEQGIPQPQPRVSRTLALQRGAAWEHLGYGTLGLNLMKGLKWNGVQVGEPNYADTPKEYRTVVRAGLPVHTQGCWEGQFMVSYCMWEGDQLPPLFAANLHNFDLVVVPNDQNRDLFSEHHDNVAKVPLGYDTTLWTELERKPQDEFGFLWCGAGAYESIRKGPDLAIKAFKAAFPRWRVMSPQPKLLMKYLQGPVDPAPDYVEVLIGQWPVEQLRDLYQRARAFVMPSRGEGWGYLPQQSVATGMPAIVSAIPGHTEYSWLPGFYEVETTKVKARSFVFGDPGMWWEPELDSLIEAYKSIYENYDQWVIESHRGHDGMSSQFSNRKMASNLCAAIGKENLVTTDTGPWQDFSLKTYLARTNRTLVRGECCIAGKHYELTAGQDYWVPASVRQTLDQAGYLLPDLSGSGRLAECPHRPEVAG